MERVQDRGGEVTSLSGARTNRRLHRWGAILIALPLLIVVGSGILLQLKKESSWIQPPTQEGAGGPPTLAFDAILAAAATVPDAGVRTWDDVDRLDVRPSKGVAKVRAKSGWEIQVDTSTGAVLQAAVRRSDLIESIHDGSFFHEKAKLWIFLPAGLILAGLWFTGVYLFFLPALKRREGRARKARLTEGPDRVPVPEPSGVLADR